MVNGIVRKGLIGILAASALLGSGCQTGRQSTELGVTGMAAGVLTGSPGLFLFGTGATLYGAGQSNGNGSNHVQSDYFFSSDWSLQNQRDSFSMNEPIAFVADVPSQDDCWVYLDVMNGSNSVVTRKHLRAKERGDFGTRKVILLPPSTLAPGRYTGVWYHGNGDEYLGQSAIVVNR